MSPHAIFVPVVAQVGLIFLVWVWMYVERLTILKRGGVDPQLLADSARADEILRAGDRSSESFTNQFEIPTLFFVAAITVHVLGWVDGVYVGLAWAFVGLRAAHAFIHCAYNRIMHRFAAYALSSVVLWVFWFRLGARICFGAE